MPPPALLVGPLRIQFDYPTELWPELEASLHGEFYEESPTENVVPFCIRFGSGGEKLEGGTVSAGKRDVGNIGDEVWIRQQGVVTRCDTAARKISMEVVPGSQPDILSRYLSSLLLPELDSLAVHAAAFVREGRAYVFPGHSGAGKSTLARIADGAGLEVLSDDTVVLGWRDGQPTAWGTTFSGDAYLASPGPAPLAALLFLNQCPENRLEPLNEPATAGRLLASSFPDTSTLRPPLAHKITERMIDITFGLAQQVPGYNLHLRPTIEFLELLP